MLKLRVLLFLATFSFVAAANFGVLPIPINSALTVKYYQNPQNVSSSFHQNPFLNLPDTPRSSANDELNEVTVLLPPEKNVFVHELTGFYQAVAPQVSFLAMNCTKAYIQFGYRPGSSGYSSVDFRELISEEYIDINDWISPIDLEVDQYYPIRITLISSSAQVRLLHRLTGRNAVTINTVALPEYRKMKDQGSHRNTWMPSKKRRGLFHRSAVAPNYAPQFDKAMKYIKLLPKMSSGRTDLKFDGGKVPKMKVRYAMEITGNFEVPQSGNYTFDMSGKLITVFQVGRGTKEPRNQHKIGSSWDLLDGRMERKGIHLLRRGLYYPFRLIVLANIHDDPWDMRMYDPQGKEIDVFGIWKMPPDFETYDLRASDSVTRYLDSTVDDPMFRDTSESFIKGVDDDFWRTVKKRRSKEKDPLDASTFEIEAQPPEQAAGGQEHTNSEESTDDELSGVELLGNLPNLFIAPSDFEGWSSVAANGSEANTVEGAKSLTEIVNEKLGPPGIQKVYVDAFNPEKAIEEFRETKLEALFRDIPDSMKPQSSSPHSFTDDPSVSQLDSHTSDDDEMLSDAASVAPATLEDTPGKSLDHTNSEKDLKTLNGDGELAAKSNTSTSHIDQAKTISSRSIEEDSAAKFVDGPETISLTIQETKSKLNLNDNLTNLQKPEEKVSKDLRTVTPPSKIEKAAITSDILEIPDEKTLTVENKQAPDSPAGSNKNEDETANGVKTNGDYFSETITTGNGNALPASNVHSSGIGHSLDTVEVAKDLEVVSLTKEPASISENQVANPDSSSGNIPETVESKSAQVLTLSDSGTLELLDSGIQSNTAQNVGKEDFSESVLDEKIGPVEEKNISVEEPAVTKKMEDPESQLSNSNSIVAVEEENTDGFVSSPGFNKNVSDSPDSVQKGIPDEVKNVSSITESSSSLNDDGHERLQTLSDSFQASGAGKMELKDFKNGGNENSSIKESGHEESGINRDSIEPDAAGIEKMDAPSILVDGPDIGKDLDTMNFPPVTSNLENTTTLQTNVETLEQPVLLSASGGTESLSQTAQNPAKDKDADLDSGSSISSPPGVAVQETFSESSHKVEDNGVSDAMTQVNSTGGMSVPHVAPDRNLEGGLAAIEKTESLGEISDSVVDHISEIKDDDNLAHQDNLNLDAKTSERRTDTIGSLFENGSETFPGSVDGKAVIVSKVEQNDYVPSSVAANVTSYPEANVSEPVFDVFDVLRVDGNDDQRFPTDDKNVEISRLVISENVASDTEQMSLEDKVTFKEEVKSEVSDSISAIRKESISEGMENRVDESNSHGFPVSSFAMGDHESQKVSAGAKPNNDILVQSVSQSNIRAVSNSSGVSTELDLMAHVRMALGNIDNSVIGLEHLSKHVPGIVVSPLGNGFKNGSQSSKLGNEKTGNFSLWKNGTHFSKLWSQVSQHEGDDTASFREEYATAEIVLDVKGADGSNFQSTLSSLAYVTKHMNEESKKVADTTSESGLIVENPRIKGDCSGFSSSSVQNDDSPGTSRHFSVPSSNGFQGSDLELESGESRIYRATDEQRKGSGLELEDEKMVDTLQILKDEANGVENAISSSFSDLSDGTTFGEESHFPEEFSLAGSSTGYSSNTNTASLPYQDSQELSTHLNRSEKFESASKTGNPQNNNIPPHMWNSDVSLSVPDDFSKTTSSSEDSIIESAKTFFEELSEMQNGGSFDGPLSNIHLLEDVGARANVQVSSIAGLVFFFWTFVAF